MVMILDVLVSPSSVGKSMVATTTTDLVPDDPSMSFLDAARAKLESVTNKPIKTTNHHTANYTIVCKSKGAESCLILCGVFEQSHPNH